MRIDHSMEIVEILTILLLSLFANDRHQQFLWKQDVDTSRTTDDIAVAAGACFRRFCPVVHRCNSCVTGAVVFARAVVVEVAAVPCWQSEHNIMLYM